MNIILVFNAWVYGVNKKSGISGILADFGNVFLQPVIVTNLLKIILFLGFFEFFKRVKKISLIF